MRPRGYLYSPPEGYFDLPMLWPFSASALTAGQNYLNQQVPIYAGYGDFVLRRVVGLDRVLNNGRFSPFTVGQFQIRDAQGRYLEEVPQYVGKGGPGTLFENAAQLAVVPELLFRENTQIKFDLTNAGPAFDPNGTTNYGAQLAFHGVRRLKGKSPYPASYRYHPKTYAYVFPVNLQAQTSPLTTVTQSLAIVNYDFELWELRLLYAQCATVTIGGAEGQGLLVVTAVQGGPAGNAISVVINAVASATPITISVTGNVITVSVSTTTPAGTATTYAVAQALNSNPLSAALVTSVGTPAPPYGTPVPSTPTGTFHLSGGGSALSTNDPWSLLQIYDQNGVGVYYSPVVDLYVNRLSYYLNGAFVPPLVYQQNTQLKVDMQSLLINPATALLHLIGRQRIPC